ncbi:hypothetical protein CABS01_03736, partial [Colletotrichum abscissum]
KILDSSKVNAGINNNDARSNDEASDKGVGDTIDHLPTLAHSSASARTPSALSAHPLPSSPHRSAKPAQHTTHKPTAKQPAPHTPPANNHGAETKNLTRRCRTSVPDEPPLIVLRNLRSIPPGSARRSRAEQSPARPPRCSSLRVPGPRRKQLQSIPPAGVPYGYTPSRMRLWSSSLMGTSLLTVLAGSGPALATVPILTEVSLKGCADVDCPPGAVDDLVGESNCTLAGSVLRRVGIAPEVLDIPIDDKNTTDIRKLSLTVATVANSPAPANSPSWIKKQLYTQSYYLGAPAGLNLSSESYPKGCALIFQHMFQTLPTPHEVPDLDTTDCSPWLQQSCMDEITGYVDDFRTAHSNDETLPRCQEIAMYLEERTRTDKDFHCNLVAGAVNITGVDVIGPDAPTVLAQDAGDADDNNDCHPTLPQSYDMFKLTDVELILDGDGSTTKPTGGLNGYTPVMSVLFDKLLYSQWICMKTMSEYDQQNASARTSTPLVAGLIMALATLVAIMML